MKRVLMVVCLAACSGVVHAEELGINLSGEALHANFDGSLKSIFPRLNGLYDIGGLFGKNDYSGGGDLDYREGHVGMLVTGDAGAQQANVTAGLGGRIALLGADAGAGGNFTGGALALGGMIEARLPAFNRIGALAYFYGAPNVSSFGDFTRYFEYSGDVDYEVLQSASVYAGFRQLKVGVDNVGTVTVDSGWHLGLRLKF